VHPEPLKWVKVLLDLKQNLQVRYIGICGSYCEGIGSSISESCYCNRAYRTGGCKPPELEVTVYPVITEPPLLPGAVNVTVAWAFPAVAVPIVGAPGTVEVGEGVTEFEAELAGPVPLAFVALL